MKKIVKSMAIIVVVFCIIGILDVKTSDTVEKNAKDVAALNEIIKEQAK